MENIEAVKRFLKGQAQKHTPALLYSKNRTAKTQNANFLITC